MCRKRQESHRPRPSPGDIVTKCHRLGGVMKRTYPLSALDAGSLQRGCLQEALWEGVPPHLPPSWHLVAAGNPRLVDTATPLSLVLLPANVSTPSSSSHTTCWVRDPPFLV